MPAYKESDLNRDQKLRLLWIYKIHAARCESEGGNAIRSFVILGYLKGKVIHAPEITELYEIDKLIEHFENDPAWKPDVPGFDDEVARYKGI